MRNLKLKLGLLILGFLLLLALGGPWAARHLLPLSDPLRIANFEPFQTASSSHLIGTDRWGRDALAVFLESAWQTFLIGLVAGSFATLVGATLGFFSGYLGGRIDGAIRTGVDMFLVMPTLPIFLSLSLYISSWNIWTLSLLLGAFTWPFGARIIRAQVLSLRRREYLDLARLSGEGSAEIVFLELMPALAPFLCLSLSSSIVAAMLAEAALQFVGIGAGRLSTLGYMIGEGFNNGYLGIGLYGQMLLPAVVLVLAFLGFQLLNMGLEEAFNPRLQTVLDK